MLTISSFARLVGLSPSALRFYDDCDLLRPYDVDARSGYRYYSADQQRRAVMIRRLREIDLPLHDIRAVLDGDRDEAAALLQRHAGEYAGRARRTGDVVADLVAGLADDDTTASTVTVGGPELASAIRQVSPAAARIADVPALQGVLLEIDGAELAVVATDRYWLALRTLPAYDIAGPVRRLLVHADQLTRVAAWVARHDRVRLCGTDAGATIAAEGGDESLPLDLVDDEFPSYRTIFGGLPTWTSRVIVDRAALQDALDAASADRPVVLSVGADHLDVCADGEAGGVRLDAINSGAELAIAFSPTLLTAALAASVGPDVLLEMSAEDRPVVVRSADQGTFTTLVMPVRREENEVS
ncbi:hypothetical protein VV01_16765 [Luteipulveratus halotolerans]|uniref:HTH merR-type domain-containing protein n=1 Tax=Luteipulveratus halotolerans TaxID=1631356 RepID=A0A0L6CP87_9MICO|nr:hypothetical protein VV01_16765 [Luteipulveratus halotolerans]